MNILLGNKEAMSGIGSGKVLERYFYCTLIRWILFVFSGPDDNVFVYFTDHGSVGKSSRSLEILSFDVQL